jgi:hypothetical protein
VKYGVGGARRRPTRQRDRTRHSGGRVRSLSESLHPEATS